MLGLDPYVPEDGVVAPWTNDQGGYNAPKLLAYAQSTVEGSEIARSEVKDAKRRHKEWSEPDEMNPDGKDPWHNWELYSPGTTKLGILEIVNSDIPGTEP